jgi:hypothetical protein
MKGRRFEKKVGCSSKFWIKILLNYLSEFERI